MTAGTIEVVPVEDLELMLGQSPPCEAWTGAFIRCGQPAAVRITMTCPDCGAYSCFLCAHCLAAVQSGRAACRQSLFCGRRDFAWREC